MNNRPVLFIDSGIGGLTYLNDFTARNPREEVCYTADCKNFPYGPREKEEISSILISLTEKLLKLADPKIIVLACNTATISALEPLRKNFPDLPFVGTVPAVKPAAGASITGKVGILGTARTIEDPYSQHIAENCETRAGSQSEIFGIAAPELVEFIEQSFDKADKNEKKEIVKKYIDLFRAEGVDTLVLGCTHFLYLLEEFRKEAEPVIRVFDSLGGVTKRIEFLLDENGRKLRVEENFKPAHQLFLTEKDSSDSLWKNRAEKLGLKLSFV
ncbi:MAG: glutamate racemase [Treponema sp.]|nr:glutamate racemase [Treponema sp.]